MSANKGDSGRLVSAEGPCAPKFCWHKQLLTQVSLEVSAAVGTHTRERTHFLPTETRVSVSIEALVALAEIRANDVATASIGVTPMTT